MGTALRTTLFGESHGPAVGALIEGMPPGTPIDEAQLAADLQARRPGGRYASRRAESDQAQLLSGIHQGCATGYPILVLVRNEDARTKDYSFLPDHPRPGHADLPMMRGTAGHADLRGGICQRTFDAWPRRIRKLGSTHPRGHPRARSRALDRRGHCRPLRSGRITSSR